MPTYEYECSKCHHQFDAFQTMSSEVYKTCPEELCQMKKWGKGNVKRLIGAGAGLIFKGSGFYITDYRSEGYKSSAKSDASSSTTTSAAPTKNASESKPASSSNNKNSKPAASVNTSGSSSSDGKKTTKKG